MGCTSSSTNINGSFKCSEETSPTFKVSLTPQSSLTEDEKEIVMSTWQYMTTDIAGNGLQVFLRIFELNPEAKKLFKVENVRHSELARNPTIKGHGARFMNAIGAAVDGLKDQEGGQDKVGNILFALGQRHQTSSGFRPEYFEVFYNALMWRWEFCMGEHFTQEVSKTWSRVFLYMMYKLKEGYLSRNTC